MDGRMRVCLSLLYEGLKGLWVGCLGFEMVCTLSIMFCLVSFLFYSVGWLSGWLFCVSFISSTIETSEYLFCCLRGNVLGGKIY